MAPTTQLKRATEPVFAEDSEGVRRLVAAAGDEYDPARVQIAGVVTTPDPPETILQPLTGYDQLTEKQVLNILDGMDADQLTAVKAYERAHQARGSITRHGDLSTPVAVPTAGGPASPPPAAAAQTAGKDYAAMSVGDLQAEADRRGLTVEGTGKDGGVVKSDLVEGLGALDAATQT